MIFSESRICQFMPFMVWAVSSEKVPSNITETYLYNSDPLKPHFYIVKLGLTGVYIIFIISAQNILYCGYLLELPRRGGSNEYPKFYSFCIHLNRRVFIMDGQNIHIHILRMLSIHTFCSI